jgi:hypothetical protein
MMNITRPIALTLIIPFALLSAYAVSQVGYWGIFDYHRHSPAGWQVFADLVIALILVLTWMIPNAKENGRNPWPWVLITLTLGSIGPLAYIAFGKVDDQHAK